MERAYVHAPIALTAVMQNLADAKQNTGLLTLNTAQGGHAVSRTGCSRAGRWVARVGCVHTQPHLR